jgi:hypothetical protein
LNRVLKKVKAMYSDLIENRWFIYDVKINLVYFKKSRKFNKT